MSLLTQKQMFQIITARTRGRPSGKLQMARQAIKVSAKKKQMVAKKPPSVKVTTPFPIPTPLGFLKPTYTITPGSAPSLNIGTGFDAFKDVSPGHGEIVQKITPIGVLEPEYGTGVSPDYETAYQSALSGLPSAPTIAGGGVPSFDLGLPDFSDLGKYALIAGAALVGLLILTRR